MWISSTSLIWPSASSPSSYLVSTSSRPRCAASAWPLANRRKARALACSRQTSSAAAPPQHCSRISGFASTLAEKAPGCSAVRCTILLLSSRAISSWPGQDGSQQAAVLRSSHASQQPSHAVRHTLCVCARSYKPSHVCSLHVMQEPHTSSHCCWVMSPRATMSAGAIGSSWSSALVVGVSTLSASLHPWPRTVRPDWLVEQRGLIELSTHLPSQECWQGAAVPQAGRRHFSSQSPSCFSYKALLCPPMARHASSYCCPRLLLLILAQTSKLTVRKAGGEGVAGGTSHLWFLCSPSGKELPQYWRAPAL